jgi:hypothetical protein
MIMESLVVFCLIYVTNFGEVGQTQSRLTGKVVENMKYSYIVDFSEDIVRREYRLESDSRVKLVSKRQCTTLNRVSGL